MSSTGIHGVDLKIADLERQGLPTDILALKNYDCQYASLESTAAWLHAFWYVSSHEFKADCEGVYPMKFTKEPCDHSARLHQSKLQHALVDRHADFIADLHHLAAGDPSTPRFIHDKSRPSRDYIYEMNDLQSLLACEMFVCIDDKKASRVLTSLETQFNLLTIQTSEHSDLKYWYPSLIEMSIIDNLRIALNANVLDQFHLRHLISKMEALHDPSKNWYHIVNCSRALTLTLLQVEPSLGNVITGKDKDIRVDSSDILSFLECMERYSRVDMSNWKSAVIRLEAIQVDLPKNAALESALSLLHIAAKSLAHTRSARNQAIIACALQLYHLDHESYPSQLDALADLGIDPAKYLSMAGQSFGYRSQNQTAYLWGPVRDAQDEYPLEIMPTIPTYTSSMTAADRSRIDQALWIIKP